MQRFNRAILFDVELDIYTGPYDLLLSLILKQELEVFEISLAHLVQLYCNSYQSADLERDTDFADSATSLVLLKSRGLFPGLSTESHLSETPINREDLATRLVTYLKIQRAADNLSLRLKDNARSYASANTLPPSPGRLRLSKKKLMRSARRIFSQPAEPDVSHLGEVSVTVQELATMIKDRLMRGPISFEELIAGMDRLHAAVTFAAALSLSSEGRITLRQAEPLGSLILDPSS